MQAFARLLERQGELLKPDGGINQIAEDGLAHSRIAGEISIQRLRKQRLTKTRITLRARRYRVFELSCECHRFPRSLLRPGALAATVVCPPVSSRLDRLLLALLGAATQQDHLRMCDCKT